MALSAIGARASRAAQPRLPPSPLAWLNTRRARAVDRVGALTVPNTHDEDWRFTNVSAIAQTEFQLPHAASKLSAQQIEPYRLPGTACQLVFVNGRFDAKLSSVSSLPQGVSVGSLAEEIRRDPKPLEKSQ